MNILAHFDAVADIVTVTAHAEINAESIIAGGKKALFLSQTHHCDNLLFDLRQCTEGQSLMQGFSLMQNVRETIGFSLNHRIAIVYDPAKYSTERATFIENVVANRPNPLYRVFTEIDAAIAWLQSNTPERSGE